VAAGLSGELDLGLRNTIQSAEDTYARRAKLAGVETAA
jgi:hypothetical protein